MKLYAAPLQGFTEAPWRNLHQELFGGIDAYYTPFVRIEKGAFRNKDVRDIAPENNTVSRLVPQLIAASPAELERLATLFTECGYREVDINLGCPFPLMAGKHKGSGILPYPSEVEALLKELPHYPELSFSVKMRLGWECADEWRALLPLLNAAPLRQITLHPRVGKQQYKGMVDRASFAAFYAECTHPLVYNGDVLTVDDIRRVEAAFPRLEGIMLGRGLLANPALAEKYVSGNALSTEALYERVKALHARLFQHYETCLQGDAQLLSKLKPYWEYLLPEADRKIRKEIKKATTVGKYLAAVARL
ncbi:MAG: tRNA-dihydrouridine synthase family protein [Phocaeicola sp.]|nr:tRNA-dihydrouridine synthase family protein [Phocaeicola sp.]